MPSRPPEPTLEQQRALELLQRGERFLLTGHVRPDGDCLGAQAALSRVLAALGKQVFVLNTDPPQPQLEFLGEACRFGVWRGGDLPVHDVAVFLDFCELSRTGDLAGPLARAGSKKLVIDHHVHEGETWWDAAYVDRSAAATGLLVVRIARQLGVALDSLAALGAFTSIVTDTGWFKYSNTDVEALSVAAELVRAGVRPHELYGAIYQRQPSDQPRAIARLLSRLQYRAGGRLAVVDLPLARAGEAELADSDDVLDLLRSVGRVEVVLFLRETADGGVKLSARSKTDFDVQRLARGFGGGGHVKAAGATLPGPLARAVEDVAAAAEAQLAPAQAEARP